MELHTWLVYLTACVALSISPGPNGFARADARSHVRQRLTLFTIAGGAAGFVLLIALSMFGIGALPQASLVWLTVLKVVGGVYLVVGHPAMAVAAAGSPWSPRLARCRPAAVSGKASCRLRATPRASCSLPRFCRSSSTPARPVAAVPGDGGYLRSHRDRLRAHRRRSSAPGPALARERGAEVQSNLRRMFGALGIGLALRD